MSPLPPDHICRRDDPLYESAQDWFSDHHGYAPVDMFLGLNKRMKEHNETFAQAWLALVDRQIILIEPKVPDPGQASES